MTDRQNWQASIEKFGTPGRPVDSTEEATAALAGLGEGWELVEAVDAELGIWLVDVPEDVAIDLENGDVWAEAYPYAVGIETS